MCIEGFLQCSPLLHLIMDAMLYYVVEAVTKDAPVRLYSFSELDHANRYATAYRNENTNSFWIGVVDHVEWFRCFA